MSLLPPALQRLPLFSWLLPLWLAASPLQAGEPVLEAPDEIIAMLQEYLPEEAGSPHKLELLLSQILATEGYFSPQFEFSEDKGEVRVKINAGPRTRIASVDVAVDGQIEAKTRANLIADWRLPVGQPFRQEEWNEAKQHVLAQLLSSEHAAAKLLDSAAEIDPETQQARLSAHYDTGPRYRFGEMQIEGLKRYSPALIERYNRELHPGDLYADEKLNKLLANLQATPYFASVQAAVSYTHLTLPTSDLV